MVLVKRVLAFVAAGLFLLALVGATPVDGLTALDEAALGGLCLAVAVVL